MGLRSTYNTGVHGSGAYGVPETTQGAVTASISFAASANAVAILDASSSASVGFVASNPTPVRVVLGAVNANLDGIMAASAVAYNKDTGFRPGYGTATYGTFVYGENYSTKDASASVSIGASASCSGVAIRQSAVAADVTIAATAQGFMSIVGAVNDAVSISTEISYNRVRLMSASDDIGVAAQVSARYKWNDIVPPTTTWVEADYRERAA